MDGLALGLLVEIPSYEDGDPEVEFLHELVEGFRLGGPLRAVGARLELRLGKHEVHFQPDVLEPRVHELMRLTLLVNNRRLVHTLELLVLPKDGTPDIAQFSIFLASILPIGHKVIPVAFLVQSVGQ